MSAVVGVGRREVHIIGDICCRERCRTEVWWTFRGLVKVMIEPSLRLHLLRWFAS